VWGQSFAIYQRDHSQYRARAKLMPLKICFLRAQNIFPLDYWVVQTIEKSLTLCQTRWIGVWASVSSARSVILCRNSRLWFFVFNIAFTCFFWTKLVTMSELEQLRQEAEALKSQIRVSECKVLMGKRVERKPKAASDRTTSFESNLR
jgi:hypothetical protein